MNRKGFTTWVVILIVIGLLTLGGGVYYYQGHVAQEKIKKDEKTSQQIKTGIPVLVYQVGETKRDVCNAIIEIADSVNLTPRKLTYNCKEPVGIVGWLNPNSLLVYKAKLESWGLDSKKPHEFGKIEVNTGRFQPLDATKLPASFTDPLYGRHSRFHKTLVKLVEREPELLSEIYDIKKFQLLSDIKIFDQVVIFIASSPEPGDFGRHVYSYNRASKKLELIKRNLDLSLRLPGGGISSPENIYILNEKEIIFRPHEIGFFPDQPQVDFPKGEKNKVWKANLDGSNSKQLIGEPFNIEFVSENTIGGILRKDLDPKITPITPGVTPWRIAVFDVKTETLRVIPLSGILREDTNGNRISMRILVFSEKANKVAFDISIRQKFDPEKIDPKMIQEYDLSKLLLGCALYVLDLSTEKVTKITERCPFSKVSWSE
jgi:hypothetical protein